MSIDFKYSLYPKTTKTDCESSSSIPDLKLTKIGLLCTRQLTDYSRRFMKILIGSFFNSISLYLTYELYLRLKPGLFSKNIDLNLIFDQTSYKKIKNDVRDFNHFVLEYENLSIKHEYLLKDLFVVELIDKLLVLEATKYSKNISSSVSLCAEKGKEVFCLPGKFFDSSSFGSNKLIFDGAVPLYSLDLLKD